MGFQRSFKDRSRSLPLAMDSSSGIGKIEVACRVCGDKASGKHYGVPSCDGCRGFFKRSIRRNLDYVCKENNRCIVDVTRRNQCQACRFSKCLRVNMKKDAVQHERAPRTCIPSHAQMTFNGSGFYGPSRRLSVPVHASPLTISPSLTLSMPPNHAALVAPFQAISQMPVLPGHLSQVEGPASSQHDFHHLSQTHPHLFNSPTAFGHMSFGLNHLFGASGFATLKNASNFEMNTLGGVRSNTFVAGHLPYSIGETTHFPSSILHQPLIDNFPTGHNSSNPVNSNPPKSSSENCKTQENRASEYTAKEDEVTSSEESNKALGKITNSIEDTPASNAFAIHSSTNEKRNQHTDDTFTVQNIMKSIPRNFEKHLQSICDRENILKQANKLCDIFRQSNISKDDEMTSSIGENIYESSAKLLFLSVKWAKTVPSFLQLKNVDQKVLLSSTWKELFVLTAAQCALPSVTSQLCKRRGTLSSSLQSDASRLDDLMKQMDNMKIDHSEYSFLKAAILFQPDAVNGDMKQLVEMLQDQTLTMLLDYCVKYKTPTRAGRLLLMLPSVICLAKHGRIEELLFKDTVGNIAIENILTEIDTYKQP